MATQSSQDPASKTPDKWSQFKDARENSGAGQYPNHWVRQTRSGHTMIFDDSQGNESITIQHRSGAMIQFMADGAVQYVSHNGQQNIIFGENRVVISGAQDTTVKGDSSCKTEGECNITVNKGMHTSVGGAIVTVAESSNQQFAKQADMKAESSSSKITKNASMEAGGSMTISSQGGTQIASDKSGLCLYGETGVGIRGLSTVTLESPAQVSVQGGSAVAMDAPEIHFNSGKSKSVAQSVTMPNPESA